MDRSKFFGQDIEPAGDAVRRVKRGPALHEATEAGYFMFMAISPQERGRESAASTASIWASTAMGK